MSVLKKRNVTFDSKITNQSTLKSVKNVLKESIKSNKSSPQANWLSAALYIAFFIVFLMFSIFVVDYLHELNDSDTIALQTDEFSRLFFKLPCSSDYGSSFKKCLPKKCGRGVTDILFEKKDITQMLNIAKKGMELGGGSGGATILDLHSGALSHKDKFINIYTVNSNIFNRSHFLIYTKIKEAIRLMIAKEFEIDEKHLYLTKPTFFSRLNNVPPQTKHDEYWHPHIDRITYESFYYTSLLYLSNYNDDFTGGRFFFVDKHSNQTIEPRFGRVSFFTSGSENKHYVERVENGTRFALTVSFTCDKKYSILDPGV
ncbi:2-oxoglutarate and iron-dependent oxygenase domain-containing protein 3 [Hydra vulgaris]|uniref:2-oxoglutarate and iron-dependent oxygenase domain-containing protein 3 n=1 Tax=Hydra vulgaris TaxID=6087 RepID=A0ABM4D5V2_HYDVU